MRRGLKRLDASPLFWLTALAACVAIAVVEALNGDVIPAAILLAAAIVVGLIGIARRRTA
jgi:hypothetical protein